MEIAYANSAKPILAFSDLQSGEIFYFKDDPSKEPVLKISDTTSVGLKWNVIYLPDEDFPSNAQVGRIKGRFYVEEVM